MPVPSSQKDVCDLCEKAGEVFSKFGLLFRDLDDSSSSFLQDSTDDNKTQQQQEQRHSRSSFDVGWDAQSVKMFREAVQNFSMALRDISTIVAEKRTRER
ncbi:unnamed protein product [Didymodactylos carnosus]|uniref:Uncharacterized protein n=1 Tax=Didymodactylos carnosus TaxID=1234261 RepID=A0A813R991_9BILA|nr:unnamed protein product [Didymodactylos carnosus]CAF3561580.1 unnamed protein product [Didymodactylos carnosus]